MNAAPVLVNSNLLREVDNELISAESKFPPMHSAHEAYAVILEEVDEFWEYVRANAKNRNPQHGRSELIQIAAMALRAIKDRCL